MWHRMLPKSKSRRWALGGAAVVLATLGILSLKGVTLFDFSADDATDFSQPLAMPTREEKVAAEVRADAVRLEGLTRDLAAEAAMREQVAKLFASLTSADAAERDDADVRLRNLPVSAAPIVAELYEKEREGLGPEARARLERSAEMFRALSALHVRRRERTDWLRRNLLAAYNDVGERNANWDDATKAIITLGAESPWTDDVLRKLAPLVEAAVRSGCNDPLVGHYVGLFRYEDPNRDETETVQLLWESGNGMQGSEYPFWVKVLVMAKNAELIEAMQGELPRIVNVNQLKMSVPYAFRTREEGPELHGGVLYDAARMAYEERVRFDTNLKEMKEISATLQKAVGPDSPYVKLFEGVCYMRQAAKAPQYPQPKLDPEALIARQEQHLHEAEARLKGAYEADPGEPLIALEMMNLYEQRGDDANREKWFRLALRADPDSYEACRRKWQSLPTDEWLSFGRELLAQGNWRGELPLILMDAHATLASWSSEKEVYWEQPGVWDDVRAVYGGYLEHFPGDVVVRSKYARYANRCRQWAEADRQFKLLGDGPSMRVFGSMTSYDYHRKKAARNLAAQAAANPRSD